MKKFSFKFKSQSDQDYELTFATLQNDPPTNVQVYHKQSDTFCECKTRTTSSRQIQVKPLTIDESFIIQIYPNHAEQSVYIHEHQLNPIAAEPNLQPCKA